MSQSARTVEGGPGAQPLLGGVETGGTKIVCVVGYSTGQILDSIRIPVGRPAETIAAVVAYFASVAEAGMEVRAIGVGSFGPLELRRGHPRFGWITKSPKVEWTNTDLLGALADGISLPIALDTDVNAAALAEGRFGAAEGLRNFVYLTIGTGIGGGAIVNGEVIRALVHTEMGHLVVTRRHGDDFEGVCPYHHDCLEGLASGTALRARFGRSAETLGASDAQAARAVVAHYLALGCRSLVYALAPERIVIGGGVGLMDGLAEATCAELREVLAGYPGLPEHDADGFVVRARLGGLAGPTGTLLLASSALNG